VVHVRGSEAHGDSDSFLLILFLRGSFEIFWRAKVMDLLDVSAYGRVKLEEIWTKLHFQVIGIAFLRNSIVFEGCEAKTAGVWARAKY
jgi:hypothetical protein